MPGSVIEIKNKVRGLGVFGYKDEVLLLYSDASGRSCLARSSDGLSFEMYLADLNLKQLEIGEMDKVVVVGNSRVGMCLAEKGGIKKIEFDGERFVLKGVLAGEYLSAVPIDKRRYLASSDEGLLELSGIGQGERLKTKKVLSRFEYALGGEELRVMYCEKEKKEMVVVCASKGKKGVVLGALTLTDKGEVVWQAREELMGESGEWPAGESRILGVVRIGEKLISYWQVADWGVFAVIGGYFKAPFEVVTKPVSMGLSKSKSNPILGPRAENSWEAFNTFNPAAIYEGGKVHLVYRAQGYDYVSVLGYASSSDGVSIDRRLDRPVYTPRAEFEWRGGGESYETALQYVSGGGYGGCEDPRLTRVGDRVYMTYVAFDGWSPPRVALTSIALSDFLAHRWLWERPVLITRPGEVNKNCVIFPRMVGGKYVIIHRVFPDILLDYVDSLDFDGRRFLQGQYKIKHRPKGWDSRKLGAGAPPIETPDGWLLIYQAVDERDAGRYKIGAMLLDLDRPEKVIARPEVPILEPTDWYENEGFKAGVAYPCGAVVIEGMLYVYYGGADSVVCVATIELRQLLAEMKHGKLTKLSPQRTMRVI